MKDKVSMACFVVICIYTAIAIIAPMVFSDWESSYDYNNLNAAPSLSHPLGTDALGRSVLKKTLLGTHVSMTVGFMSNIIAETLGIYLN